MNNPYAVTKQLEENLSEYTGAPYVVCVNSCSAALLLALKWHRIQMGEHSFVRFPSRTYCSAPMAAIHAGFDVTFQDFEWSGAYQIWPTNVWDSARRFTSNMYRAGQFHCVSFSTTKILGIEQGGAILLDDPEADIWFRKMRFDGRTEGVDPKDDTFDLVGHHVIMLPSIAAQLVLKLHHLPKVNEDLPNYSYPDLSLHPAFK